MFKGKKAEFDYDPFLDKAFKIAISTINRCKGYGGFRPDSGSHYTGIWLADTVFTLESYLYLGADAEELFKNIIDKFGSRQDSDGYMPMVFWGKEGIIDYGGRYDLANDRKQNRDLEGPYLFIHANYLLWKYFNIDSYIKKYFAVMERSLTCLEKRRDPESNLILSTYGPASCDICVDNAIPQTTAYPYFTSLYIRSYQEFGEMASALGRARESGIYFKKAEDLRKKMNTTLWNKKRNRYEVKVLKTPVTT